MYAWNISSIRHWEIDSIIQSAAEINDWWIFDWMVCNCQGMGVVYQSRGIDRYDQPVNMWEVVAHVCEIQSITDVDKWWNIAGIWIVMLVLFMMG